MVDLNLPLVRMNRQTLLYKHDKQDYLYSTNYYSCLFQNFQEISTTECTDEAGKVLKPSGDNPFIESSQQPNVVDMRGKSFSYFIWEP